MKYEYRTPYFTARECPKHRWRAYFDEMGADGWELVQVIREKFIDGTNGDSSYTFIFKRATK